MIYLFLEKRIQYSFKHLLMLGINVILLKIDYNERLLIVEQLHVYDQSNVSIEAQ